MACATVMEKNKNDRPPLADVTALPPSPLQTAQVKAHCLAHTRTLCPPLVYVSPLSSPPRPRPTLVTNPAQTTIGQVAKEGRGGATAWVSGRPDNGAWWCGFTVRGRRACGPLQYTDIAGRVGGRNECRILPMRDVSAVSMGDPTALTAVPDGVQDPSIRQATCAAQRSACPRTL